MRNLRTLCSAVVLALALTSPALAGEIHTPGEPPRGTIHTPATTPQGNIQTGVSSQGSAEDEAADTVTQIALSLLQSVLSLF